MKILHLLIFTCVLNNAYGQSSCELRSFESWSQSRSSIQTPEVERKAYNDYNPSSGVHIYYKGSPIDKVGNFHDLNGNVTCTGIYRNEYVLTHRGCIENINQRTDIYFTLYIDGEIHTEKIQYTAISGPLGAATLKSSILASKGYGTIRTGFDFGKYLNQKGWVLKGSNYKDITEFSLADDCYIQSADNNQPYLRCSESLSYQAGSVMMGNLCGEWIVVGIKSYYGDYYVEISKASLKELTSLLNCSAPQFSDSKSCTQISKKTPIVAKKLPSLDDMEAIYQTKSQNSIGINRDGFHTPSRENNDVKSLREHMLRNYNENR